jgi:hypothetical protein
MMNSTLLTKTSLVSSKVRRWARMHMVVATLNSIPKMASTQREEIASGITLRRHEALPKADYCQMSKLEVLSQYGGVYTYV